MAEVSRIKGGGHSGSWTGQKKQAVKVMAKLLVELKGQLGISGVWDSLGQDKLALRALYEYFIGFMVRDLKKNSGGVYAPGTITKFVAIMIKAAVDKYQMNPIPAMQRLASALDTSRFTADRAVAPIIKTVVPSSPIAKFTSAPALRSMFTMTMFPVLSATHSALSPSSMSILPRAYLTSAYALGFDPVASF